MTPSGPGALVYSRHVLRVDGEPRFDAALSQLASLGDRIAVNVIEPEAAEPMAMSEAHLRRAVAAAGDRIEVDTIPLLTFFEVMRLKLSELDRQVDTLRAALRGEYVEELLGDIQPLLRNLEQILFLVEAFALQRRDGAIAGPAGTLASSGAAIVKAVETRDNVMCLDSLHYELTPAIRQLVLAFTP